MGIIKLFRFESANGTKPPINAMTKDSLTLRERVFITLMLDTTIIIYAKYNFTGILCFCQTAVSSKNKY